VSELVDHILAAAPELDESTAIWIAHRLQEHERPITAREVADHLGLQRTDWVYSNAESLGGWRLGEGRQPRWRFYISEVEARLRETGTWQPPRPDKRSKPKARTPPRGERRPGRTAAGNELLDFGAA
jgi:hypothetical protein